MRYPYVESSRAPWEFETIYHDPESHYFRSVKLSETRADVDHAKVIYSGVFRDIAELGGDPDDVADATLYWVAYTSACEMRISTTPPALERVGVRWGLEPGEELSQRLRARAEELLSAAALVGTLRALAWQLGQTTPSIYRRSLIASARAEYRRCELVSGEANLIADDAHAHLAIAERFKPGHDELRHKFVVQGVALLGAAHAQALLEPWNPFVLHRLRAEMKEHDRAITEVTTLLPSLAENAAQAVAETQAFHAASDTRFAEWTNRYHGDDIAAYFEARKNSPGSVLPSELSEASRGLLELEPTLARLM